MGRPFVNSLTPEQLATAVNKHNAYVAARRVGSVKALAADHGITRISMHRILKRHKEMAEDVSRNRPKRSR